MARVFSESDFSDSAPGPRVFSESDFADSKTQSQPQPEKNADAAQFATMFGLPGPNSLSDMVPDGITPYKALLTNQPIDGMINHGIRGLPASTLGFLGGLAGGGAGLVAGLPAGVPGMAAGSVKGAIVGAGIGGVSGESVRNAAVNYLAARNGEQFTKPEEVISNVAIQGATNALTEGSGQLVSAGLRRLPQVGAAFMRNMAGVPEKSGRAALEDLSLLRRAPNQEQVSEAYKAFHDASGTVSRKEFIAKSDDPFDTVSRAMDTMREASNKLRSGSLTQQEAVNASQAGRLIRDQKMRGNETAREVAEQASELKSNFDNFIQTTIEAKKRVVPMNVAQKLKPELVNMPFQESGEIVSQLRNTVDMVNRAKGAGVNPKSIMSESERQLFDQFRSQIESSAEHNVPIETLLTKSEMNPPITKYAEKTVFKKGDMIRGQKIVETPARQGYPEYKNARQMAFEQNVAEDFSSYFPVNQNGSPNQLRGYGSIAGAGLAATTALATGHPLAAIPAAISPVLSSPRFYGAAIRWADFSAPVVNATARGFRFAPGSIAAYYTSPGVATP